MAELEDKLNAILSNPEAMGQIMSIAQALTGSGSAPTEKNTLDAGSPSPAASVPADDGTTTASPPAESYLPVEPEGTAEISPAPTAAQPDWSAVINLLSNLSGSQSSPDATASSSPLGELGNLDPKLIETAMTLFSQYSANDDRKIALLYALKPFLKESRYAKMDRAIHIAKLSRVIRVAFQLLKKEGGEAGV